MKPLLEISVVLLHLDSQVWVGQLGRLILDAAALLIAARYEFLGSATNQTAVMNRPK